MSDIRAFVAVELSSAVIDRARSLIERLRPSGADVKWVEPQNMHLTLQFLGDVPEAQTAEVCRAVNEAAKGFQPFEVSLAGAGCFPDARRPRTLWIGVQDGLEPLTRLQAAIEAVLGELGFPGEDRQFHPHLTIGRVRQGGGPAVRELGQLVRQHADFDAARATIDHVTVFSSVLGKAGPTYQALGRAPLA
jgi:2'-5' RNA ligase